MRFTELLASEFARRRRHNPRHSMRAFARCLGIHHATLSRLLGTERPVQASTIRALGPRLQLAPATIASLIAEEDAQLVIRAIGRPAFRADSRWLAAQSGISVDRINIALHRLIHQRQLRMESPDRWSVIRNEGATSE